MNASHASNPDIFDVRKIRRLVELMKEHELSEIDLQQGEMRVQLRRPGGVAQPVVVAAPAAPLPATPAVPQAAPAASETPAAADADKGFLFVKSPMVGTFYAAPDPESPPFIKVGDHVGSDTTVCIVEAMKVFNQIPAEVAGRVVAVLAENGSPVEFGQPLFKVDPRG